MGGTWIGWVARGELGVRGLDADRSWGGWMAHGSELGARRAGWVARGGIGGRMGGTRIGRGILHFEKCRS